MSDKGVYQLHRAGRLNLVEYAQRDISTLRHAINAVSPHVYESTGEDYLALISLAQHYGYPTPLLDWTESPYVAAFFGFGCYDEPRKEFLKEDKPPVRIFVFDRENWPLQFTSSLKDPYPNMQFVRPAAHNNPSFYPQQSWAAYTNVADVQQFISTQGQMKNQSFLTCIDLHASARIEAEHDLRLMGVTASTLFPGIEGICRDQRMQFFD